MNLRPFFTPGRKHCGAVSAFVLMTAFHPLALQSQTVSIVQTTADQAQLLERQVPVEFERTKPGSMPGSITINIIGTRKQLFDGVGAALTDSGAWLIQNKLTADQKTELLKALFARDGAGLNVLTTGMSGSGYDMDGPASFTYDDIASGTDFRQNHFSVVGDDAYIVPVLHEIQHVNPGVKLIGVPYSAPAWMKDSGKLDTGTFIGRPKYERSFATYFVKYVQAYEQRNLPIYALAIENEPDYTAGTYPSMLLSAPEEARIVADLGPALRRAGLGSVKILGWDHNWSVPPGTVDHGNGRINQDSSGSDDGLKYPQTLLSSNTASIYLAGTAYHCYGGDPSIQTALEVKFPQKGVWNVECGGTPLNATWPDAIKFSLGQHILPEIQNWSRSHVWWTLVQDQNFGPQYGNCDSTTCAPLVTIDTTTTPAKLVFLPGYYMLAHIGRFVRPGAQVIGSQASGMPEAAFRNPDGSYALVAYNGDPSSVHVTVKWNGSSFAYTMAPNAIVTFTWAPKPVSHAGRVSR